MFLMSQVIFYCILYPLTNYCSYSYFWYFCSFMFILELWWTYHHIIDCKSWSDDGASQHLGLYLNWALTSLSFSNGEKVSLHVGPPWLEGGIIWVNKSIFLILINESFLISVLHPGVVIPYMESLALVKVFPRMDSCSYWCF